MYSNTGYWQGNEREFFEKPPAEPDVPLQILSCGVYRLIKKSYMSTSRPLGRPDYQLLYIHKGKAWFYFEGQDEVELKAGHMILYSPGELQHYHYLLQDHPEVYWLHFFGTEAEDHLSPFRVTDSSFLYTGSSQNFVDLFLQMILELQQKRPFSDQILVVLFQQLFLGIRRSMAENLSPKKSCCPELEQAISWFHLHYSQDISIRELAQTYNMSACWFIRSFKKQMGITPLQYITSLRIQKACELLETTSYTIQEIGELTGYENPLYFSRIFKEKTGCSPREYRRQR